MELPQPTERDTMINNELELIVKSRLLIFDGYWNLDEDDLGSVHDTFALPVTYDYLINIHNSNNLIYPDDLRAFLTLLEDRPRSKPVMEFNIRVINASGEIKMLRGSGRFVDAQRAKPSLAEWDNDTSETEVKLKTFEYAEEVSSAGCWRWNLSTDVLYISENLNRIFGLRVGHTMSGWNPLMQGVHPDDRERVWYALMTGKTQFKTFAVKFRVSAPDGEMKYFRCKGEPYESKTHNTYLIGIVQDVTRYEKFTHTIRAQQAELTEKHKLLESVIQSDIVALSVLKDIRGADGNIEDFEWVMANKLLKAIAQGQNVTGKRYTEIFPDAGVNGSLDLMRKVMRTGERAVNEFYHQDSNVKGWFRGVYARMNDLLIVAAEDITADKEAAQEETKNLQIMLQTEAVAGIGSWELIIPDNQFTWSEGMYTLFEMPSGTKVRPEVYLQFASREDLDVAEKIVHRLKHDPAPFDEIVTINAGGRQKTLRVKATVMNDENDRPWKVLGVDFDISALAESEHLKELNSRLKELDRAKTKFFSNVSHEFRTPLTLLLGPLEDVIKNGGLADHDLHKLEMVYRNGMRLQKLVNTLLDFSRIEGGKLEAFYQPTDLHAFTAELAGNFRSLIEKEGLKFSVKTPDGGGSVYVNREMWEKIVFNLLSNAFKFTLKGKIEVIMKAKLKYVRLHVLDTGAGIAAGNLARIFDRFVRIDGVKARTYEGSGIGLALVKELVSLHGGSIKVKSEEGAGTEFIVTIPKGKAHLPPKQIFESTDRLPDPMLSSAYVEEAAGWVSDGKRMQNISRAMGAKHRWSKGKPVVLLADDNADMRHYLTHTLTDDFHVVAVENGKKAIDLLEEGLMPDLVLADVMMPEMDGHAMVHTLKNDKRYARIPVVLLSARSGEEAKIEGMKSGADDYLVKPFSPRELKVLIRSRIQVATITKLAAQELDNRNLALEQRVQERTGQLEESRLLIEKRNRDLKQKNQELITVNEELTNFAFIASHDLREPLRKIRLFTQELIDKETQMMMTEKGGAYARKILDSVTRMNALIDDILTFSRATSGPRSKPEPVNLNDLLQVVLGDLSEVIQGSQARIDHIDLPVLNANALQLSQLLQNLIANAIKFQAPGNTPHIRISARLVQGRETDSPLASHEARYLVLEVADNGIGFEEQYAQKIFHMFQRLHDKTQFPGTGMGLAICKKVMQNHNGFMIAKGKPGEGAVFSCYFPV